MSFNDRYGRDILGGSASSRSSVSFGHSRRPDVPEVPAAPGTVVEVADGGWVGAVVGFEKTYDGEFVRLEDRHGRDRLFKMRPGGFLIDARLVTLTRHVSAAETPQNPQRSNSGSRRVQDVRAKVAAPSRIWVEGLHDAAIVEQVWGHDLRVEGVVVEFIEGLDNLPAMLEDFRPGPGRRVGVLADHLVEGSKESRLTQGLGPDVMVTGHPYIDIWEAVKPATVGIRAWPTVPYGEDWKTGVCRRLGWGTPTDGWRHVYSKVKTFRDLDATLIGAVERLVDFVTEPDLP